MISLKLVYQGDKYIYENTKRSYFFPNRKKISLLGYIFILILLRLIICKDTHVMVAAQDISMIYSLSGTCSCENCCKTSALLYWKSLFTFQGKVPEEMVREGKKGNVYFLCVFHSALKLKRIVEHIEKVALEIILSLNRKS